MILNSIILGLNIIFFTMLIIALLKWKTVIKKISKHMGKTFLTDLYDENLTELIPGISRVGVLHMIENRLRAESGSVLHRPLGSNKKWQPFDSLLFIPVQTSPFPIDRDTEVDLSITIGPQAKKPVHLKIPILISGMAYGFGLHEKAKVALANAATKIGTATNSGEGPLLPEEREAAKHFILQFSKTSWAKKEEELKQADMIEIKLGQGASAGIGARVVHEKIKGRAAQLMNLSDNEDATIHETFFENQTKDDLINLVSDLKNVTGGIPVGAKIMASGLLEQDIDQLIEMKVDFITIDGGEAGTHYAPSILQDDFGIPTFHAIVRAAAHLEKKRMKKKVSLIVSGGLATPGDLLKVLALGADAAYVGSSILFAMSHGHVLKAMPWEPPTQIAWYNGKYKDEFSMEKGTEAAYNYLYALTEEMKVGLRAMGKTGLSSLAKADLTSKNEHIAKMVDIPYSFQPSNENKDNKQSKENQSLFT